MVITERVTTRELRPGDSILVDSTDSLYRQLTLLLVVSVVPEALPPYDGTMVTLLTPPVTSGSTGTKMKRLHVTHASPDRVWRRVLM